MNNELLEVILRTILVLVILFILTKCLGKKQVSQMNLFDYLIGITIGNIAAGISLETSKNISTGILCLLSYGFLGILVNYLTLKSISLRKFILGNSTILIDNGKILFQNLKKEGININDLQEEARQNGYFDLTKINYAILEISGKISFLPKTSNELLSTNIIIDSTILEDNLVNMNKDKNWLKNELKKKGYDNIDKILLMTLDEKNKVNIYDKNEYNNKIT